MRLTSHVPVVDKPSSLDELGGRVGGVACEEEATREDGARQVVISFAVWSFPLRARTRQMAGGKLTSSSA